MFKKILCLQRDSWSKTEVYQDHKFSICFENVINKPGYFCELMLTL